MDLYLVDVAETQHFGEPTITLFGKDDLGAARQVVVRGVPHEVYVAVPEWWREPEELRSFLDEKLLSENKKCVRHGCDCSLPRGWASPVAIDSEACGLALQLDARVVTRVEIVRRRSFIGYEETDRQFAKITLKRASYASRVGAAAWKYVALDRQQKSWLPDHYSGVYEVCANAVESFLRLLDCGAFGWLRIESDQAVVPFSALSVLREKDATPPICTMVFDIETLGRATGAERGAKSQFSDDDPICMLAAKVAPFPGELFVVGESGSVDWDEESTDWNLRMVPDEKALISRFYAMVLERDPDFIAGFSSSSFDLPRVVYRGEKHGLKPLISRLPKQPLRLKEISNPSSKQPITLVDCPGRTFLDAKTVVQDGTAKPHQCTLKGVAKFFKLEVEKDDVAHDDILGLFMGSASDRGRLALYCAKDVDVTQRLVEQLDMVLDVMAQCQFVGARAPDLLQRQKNFRYARKLRSFIKGQFLVPTYKSKGDEMVVPPLYKEIPELVAMMYAGDYEGAFVIDPKIGYHQRPVATLDFASLYPSIIRAQNLCCTTLLTPRTAPGLAKGDVNRTTAGFMFAKHRPGVLPTLLTSLMDERARVKALEKSEADPFRKRVLEMRQKAIKIFANSIYGQMGAPTNQAGCMAVAASTTAFGRKYIKAVVGTIEATFENAEVIYGDTDSVMVKLPNFEGTIDDARREFAAICANVNGSGIFPPPMKMEFENVKMRFLLLGKKRYAACAYSPKVGDTEQTLLVRGIEIVKRDIPLVVRETLEHALKLAIMDEAEMTTIFAYVRGRIAALLIGELDREELVISTRLSKAPEEYVRETKDGDVVETRPPHVEVAREMLRRGVPVVVGDRIEYILTDCGGKKISEKAMAFQFVDDTVPIDFGEYVKKVKAAVYGALCHIVGDESKLPALESLFDVRGYHRLFPSSTADRGDDPRGRITAHFTRVAPSVYLKKAPMSSELRRLEALQATVGKKRRKV